jgi:hypothetical protein
MKRLVRTLACLACAVSALAATAGPILDKAGEPASFQGLWWNSPADSESGWGMNLTHQGNSIFVTWFTYGADGNGMWLSGLLQRSGTSATYAGALLVNDAAPMGMSPWPANLHVANPTGNASLTFTDADHGSFAYNYTYTTDDDMMDMMNMYGMDYRMPMSYTVMQTKAIERQVLQLPVPDCSFTATRSPPYNYTDLWWNPDESGWGINFTHQGKVIFATWFTYGNDGKPMWLAGVLTPTSVPDTFSGDPMYSTRGAPLFMQPWDPRSFTASRMGSVKVSFADASHATLAFTANGTTLTKSIERQVFAASPTICR